MLLQRLFVFALSIYLAIAPAHASQHNLWSAATGTVSGLELTNNFNNGIDSLNTMNSGVSAPTNQLSGVPSQFNRWCNTTANPYPCNVYDGAQWLAPYYVDATNHLILNQVGGGTATVVSATTTSLCSVPQFFVTVSGTTTITGFGTGCFVGQAKKIAFSGALTLTYNATSLIVPGAANVVTAAGDTADVVYLGSSNWQVTNYQPASGQALLNPAIDVGSMVMTAALNVPSAKYLLGYGQAVSRATYATLMTAITSVQSATATNGSPTLTGLSDTTQICSGHGAAEAAFITSGFALVVSCTSTTVTLNKNATASTTGNVTFFPFGDGDGSTTFNLPDCRGAVMAGRDNMGGTPKGALTSGNYSTNPDALGAAGGNQSEQASTTLAGGNIPQVSTSYTPAGTNSGTQSFATVVQANGAGANVNAQGAGVPWASTLTVNFANAVFAGTPATITVGNASPSAAVSAAFSTLPPTFTVNCMIRVLSFLTPLRGAPMPDAVNDNQLAAIEPRRVA